MGKKRVHDADHDRHNEKHSREFAREQRGAPAAGGIDEADEVGEAGNRSDSSIVEGGEDERRGEPPRPGHVTPKGPRPLQNRQ